MIHEPRLFPIFGVLNIKIIKNVLTIIFIFLETKIIMKMLMHTMNGACKRHNNVKHEQKMIAIFKRK